MLNGCAMKSKNCWKMSRHPEFEFQREKLERQVELHAQNKGKLGQVDLSKMTEPEFVHAFYLYKGKRPTRKQAKLILEKLKSNRLMRLGTEQVKENTFRSTYPTTISQAYSMIIHQ